MSVKVKEVLERNMITSSDDMLVLTSSSCCCTALKVDLPVNCLARKKVLPTKVQLEAPQTAQVVAIAYLHFVCSENARRESEHEEPELKHGHFANLRTSKLVDDPCERSGYLFLSLLCLHLVCAHMHSHDRHLYIIFSTGRYFSDGRVHCLLK